MIQERVEVLINVPAAEAFAFVSDPRSELVWNRYAVRIEKTSPGPNALRSRHRGTYRGAGTFELEVTAYEPATKSGYSGRSRFLGWDQTDEFEPVDESCLRLKRWMAGYFKGPMRLLEPVMGGPFRARFRSSGQAIKEALESGRAAELMKALDRGDPVR